MAPASGLRLMGVLGGMGPAATIDFLAKVLRATPASSDQEHVPMIVHDVPQIFDRVAPIFAGTDEPLAAMQQGVLRLEGAGVEAIAIACVTAHHWYDRLAATVNVPILHIADASVVKLQTENAPRRLGLLATRGTCKSGFFSQRLAEQGYDLILPDEAIQLHLDQAIAAVKRADLVLAAEAAEAAGAAFAKTGIERFLIACTELPIAFAPTRYNALAVDSTLALAEACVAFSRSSSRG